MISPWYAGQTHPTWAVTWPGVDLTGATVTVRFEVGGSAAAGTGTVTLTTPSQGQFTYKPAAADFGNAGFWSGQWKAVFGDGSILFSDPFLITVVVPP